jgi:putative ABC transport system permease protein
MVLGIALGVAVVVAIDLANASAESAFRLSTESLTGKATHQILGGPGGVKEEVYTHLMRSGWAQPAAPVILAYISSPQLGDLPLQLVGIDPFSDSAFHSFWSGKGTLSTSQMSRFMTQAGAVMLSRPLAERFGLQLGSTFQINTGGKTTSAYVSGLIQPADDLAARTLEGIVLADISTAQELTGQLGMLSRIDLILPSGREDLLRSLQSQLPAEYRIAPASERTTSIEQMTAAFRLNLTALSLLAMVVGSFLIYNTMTFSVVQRRGLFGTLRCLGATRGDIFVLVLTESLLVGLAGSGLGILLGLLLGRVTVGMVSQTINDLYYTTTIRSVGVDWISLLRGAALGLAATLVTAALPAWEAALVPPRAALMRSGLEGKTRQTAGVRALMGMFALLLALAIFLYPGAGLLAGFGGTLLLVLAAALFSSVLAVYLFRLAGVLTARIFGLTGKLAPRNLVNSLSRTAVAAIALMVAVAVTVGVTVMIDSFRHTVVLWLDQTLQSDVYITAPLFTATTSSSAMDHRILQRLQAWPGVLRVDEQRSTAVQSESGEVEVSAVDNPQIGSERQFLALAGDSSSVWQRLQSGAVLLSEPLANRLGVSAPGGSLRLETVVGWHDFPVIGIYYDYASSQGTVLMALETYQSFWQDDAVTAIGLHLAPGVDSDQVVHALQTGLKDGQALEIRANSALRRDVLAVFDRTFSITIALRLLATIVAFIGVLSALFLLQIERQREIGILRALGLTLHQMRQMIFLETGILGLTAGLLALPTGYALSYVLIHVINKRSFGWTLQMSLDPWALVQGVLVAVVAALLAGLYPAWRLSRLSAVEAIRNE